MVPPPPPLFRAAATEVPVRPHEGQLQTGPPQGPTIPGGRYRHIFLPGANGRWTCTCLFIAAATQGDESVPAYRCLSSHFRAPPRSPGPRPVRGSNRGSVVVFERAQPNRGLVLRQQNQTRGLVVHTRTELGFGSAAQNQTVVRFQPHEPNRQCGPDAIAMANPQTAGVGQQKTKNTI